VLLLDTNVISEARKLRPHGAVVSWLEATPAAALYISAATIGELQSGVENARRQHPDKAAEIELWVDRLAASYAVLPMDAETFRRWAKLVHGKPPHHLIDAMIAATALIHGLTVATRNVRDFMPFGVPTFDPFNFDAQGRP
jgi:predicted nucleic acid-binding protein